MLENIDLALDCRFEEDKAEFFGSVEEEVILSTCTIDDVVDVDADVELEEADVFVLILTGSIGLPSVIGEVDGDDDFVIQGHQCRCSSSMLNASSKGS